MYYDFEKDSAPVRVVDEQEEQLLYQDVDDGENFFILTNKWMCGHFRML